MLHTILIWVLGKTFVGSEKLWELNSPYNLVICQKSKLEDWYQHFKNIIQMIIK